ncbi:hypothetical protein J437_LFUL015382 [Ladona fulva]|uniref:AATF leucine zipper-containing domain-containing protein n=1 Tax=Ladona fulva TaxID=123851 RepID=A0A8K0P6M0_LADFU|nr:hypothetical protein J437_LFUL015382 [Ladona fulva]
MEQSRYSNKSIFRETSALEECESDEEESDDGTLFSSEEDATCTDDKSENNLFKSIKSNSSVEIEKSNAVRSQIRLWDSLLEARIQLQKCLVASNKLPVHNCFDAFKRLAGSEFVTQLSLSKQEGLSLLNNLIELQQFTFAIHSHSLIMSVDSKSLSDKISELINPNPVWEDPENVYSETTAKLDKRFNEFVEDERILGSNLKLSKGILLAEDDLKYTGKKVSRRSYGKGSLNPYSFTTNLDDFSGDKSIESSRKENDDEIFSGDENYSDLLDGNENSYIPKKMRKLSDISKEITDQDVNFKRYRDDTLQKWYLRSKAASFKSSNFSAFDLSILKQIEHVLRDRESLIKRTRKRWSSYRMFGVNSSVDAKEACINVFYLYLLIPS